MAEDTNKERKGQDVPDPTSKSSTTGQTVCKHFRCTRPKFAKGLCRVCYMRYRRENASDTCECGGVRYAADKCKQCYDREYKRKLRREHGNYIICKVDRLTHSWSKQNRCVHCGVRRVMDTTISSWVHYHADV